MDNVLSIPDNKLSQAINSAINSRQWALCLSLLKARQSITIVYDNEADEQQYTVEDGDANDYKALSGALNDKNVEIIAQLITAGVDLHVYRDRKSVV